MCRRTKVRIGVCVCFCSSSDGLISHVNLVCGADLPSDYVSDCEIIEPKTFFPQEA